MKRLVKYLMVLVIGGFGFSSLPIVEAAEIKSGVCKRAYKDYKRKKGFKAFALSGNGESCGYWFKANSASEAKRKALKECRQYSQGGKCSLYKTQ